MPVRLKQVQAREALIMRLRLALYHAAGDCILFDGRPEHCPRVPHVGDQVLVAEQMFQVEGIQYVFSSPHVLEVQLLA